MNAKVYDPFHCFRKKKYEKTRIKYHCDNYTLLSVKRWKSHVILANHSKNYSKKNSTKIVSTLINKTNVQNLAILFFEVKIENELESLLVF